MDPPAPDFPDLPEAPAPVTTTGAQSPPAGRALVVGSGELAAELVREVRRRGVECRYLHRPGDRELTEALRRAPRFIAIIDHDHIEALRMALVAEHARPGVPLLVTIFDAGARRARALAAVSSEDRTHTLSCASFCGPATTMR